MFWCLRRRSPFTSAGPEPPSDSVPFTSDEITKIQDAIGNIQGLLDLIYTTNGNVITEVQNMLTIEAPKDPQVSIWSDVFEMSLGVISAVATPFVGPSAEIVAAILGGSVEHVTNEKETEKITGIDLNDSKGFGLMSARLTNTYTAMKKYLAAVSASPNVFRDKEFGIPAIRYPPLDGKTFTIRRLLEVPIPKPDSVEGTDFLQRQTNSFRSSIAKPEFQKKRYWWVYFVQDKNYKGSQFGNAYHPTGNYNPAPRRCAAPGGNLCVRKMNDQDLGKGAGIFANDEIWHHHPDYMHVECHGQNDCKTQDDYIQNFMLAMTEFTTKFPSAHIGPYTIDKDANEIRYFKWFVMNGLRPAQDGSESGAIDHKICNPAPGDENFILADGGFLNWLYIDDSAGNIVNAFGVGYRDDIIRNWTANGFQIPPTTAGF
jgi:hypothetical protein